jgi:hypothetical protein
VKTKPKYIENAIIWNRYAGENGAWLRIRDLNLIQDKFYGLHYEPAYSGTPRFIIREAYPYQEWMEKYIGTNEDLRLDEQFNFDY